MRLIIIDKRTTCKIQYTSIGERMRISNRDLKTLNDEKVYQENIEKISFDDYPYLRSLEDIEAEIIIDRDMIDRLIAHVRVFGKMICPDAMTLQDVMVPFEIEDDSILYFDDIDAERIDEEENAYCVIDGLDTIDFLLSFILPEVPIKVVSEEKKEYPKGDGWKVMTEAEFEESRKAKRDSRWDILRDLEIGKED